MSNHAIPASTSPCWNFLLQLVFLLGSEYQQGPSGIFLETLTSSLFVTHQAVGLWVFFSSPRFISPVKSRQANFWGFVEIWDETVYFPGFGRTAVSSAGQYLLTWESIISDIGGGYVQNRLCLHSTWRLACGGLGFSGSRNLRETFISIYLPCDSTDSSCYYSLPIGVVYKKWMSKHLNSW